MFITHHDYYDVRDEFQTLYACAMDLGDRDLLKQLLSISSNPDGQSIDKYARIAQNIAIEQNRWDVEQQLRFGGFVY